MVQASQQPKLLRKLVIFWPLQQSAWGPGGAFEGNPIATPQLHILLEKMHVCSRMESCKKKTNHALHSPKWLSCQRIEDSVDVIWGMQPCARVARRVTSKDRWGHMVTQLLPKLQLKPN